MIAIQSERDYMETKPTFAGEEPQVLPDHVEPDETGQTNTSTPLKAACPAQPGLLIRPRWVGQFLGREILRVCPKAHRIDPCPGCELRVFCKCAQADFAAATRVEKAVWTVLAACGAAIILYCFL